MILSSTTRFIIQASNTGRYAKLMGNGRSYRLPGRNTVATDLRRGNPQQAWWQLWPWGGPALSAARAARSHKILPWANWLRAASSLQQSQIALAQRPKDRCRKARILLRITQALRPGGLIPPRHGHD